MPAVRSSTAKQYAARYRAARAYADLSQEALAGRLGLDAQTIKRRESGKQEPKTAELIAVAAVCGVPLEFMQRGWGVLEADDIRVLLAEQSDILRELRELLSGESGELLPAIREVLGGRPSAGPEAPPPEPPRSGT